MTIPEIEQKYSCKIAGKFFYSYKREDVVGCAIFKKDALFGLIDKDGEQIFPFMFDTIEQCIKEELAVKFCNTHAFINIYGSFVSNHRIIIIGIFK